MSIVNRRNAVLGWSVLQVGKRVAKKKAKKAVPTGRWSVSAVVGAVVAFVGALYFWRRRGGGDDGGGESDE
jgi:hypothetical protein